MSSINREMAPVLKMTYPREAEKRTLSDPDIPLGKPLFRSWVLLGGLIPIERMDVTLSELGPGHRFVESSKMLAMKQWRHEREITPDPGGCVVSDRLTVEPPLRFLSPVVERFVGLFFSHRHRKLLRRFGG